MQAREMQYVVVRARMVDGASDKMLRWPKMTRQALSLGESGGLEQQNCLLPFLSHLLFYGVSSAGWKQEQERFLFFGFFLIFGRAARYVGS